jgi:thiosulfate/3-mercaptopyruvate sulfurtransferase
MTILIGAEELRRQLTDGFPVVLLDVRWKLGDQRGREHYVSGHLPGAVFVDLETELAAAPAPEQGRHPMPDIADLQSAARRWGVSRESLVVAYDDNAAMSAARAWWLLRWGGFSAVRLLDGGLEAWLRAGYPLETGDVRPEPGDVRLRAGGMPVVDADAAAGFGAQGRLLDARAAERYRGESEPVDPRAGHIPGALSAPTTDNLAADGRSTAATSIAAPGRHPRPGVRANRGASWRMLEACANRPVRAGFVRRRPRNVDAITIWRVLWGCDRISLFPHRPGNTVKIIGVVRRRHCVPILQSQGAT